MKKQVFVCNKKTVYSIYFLSFIGGSYWILELMSHFPQFKNIKWINSFLNILEIRILFSFIFPILMFYARKCLLMANKLKKAERKFTDLLSVSSNMIWEIDTNGNYSYTSPQYESILGYKISEMIGKKPQHFMPKEEAAKFDDLFAAILPLKNSFTKFEIMQLKQNKQLITTLISGTPIFNENNNFIGYRGISEDITEYKQLEKELSYQSKMQAMQELASGIAHDFSNSLHAIILYAQLILLENKEDKEDLKINLQKILEQANHSADLTKQLLTFSREKVGISKNINLTIFLKETLAIIQKTIKANIEIQAELPEKITPIHGNPTQIKQMIFNLIKNAEDAMPKGGKLIISLQEAILNKGNIKSHKNCSPGTYVCLYIRDTGIGIPDYLQEKIFEPFFTTKSHNEGTGLGLAIVYGIVQKHKGFISLFSKQYQGTEFKICLPSAKKEKILNEKKQNTKIIRGAETILLVEDKQEVLEIMEKMLKNLGYKIFPASNGQEALEIYEKESQKIDLVITDLIMPKMSADDLCFHMSNINPKIKIMLISGYHLTEKEIKKFAKHNVKIFMQKPTDIAEISQNIRQLLNHK